jgi:hypothetical protein
VRVVLAARLNNDQKTPTGVTHTTQPPDIRPPPDFGTQLAALQQAGGKRPRSGSLLVKRAQTREAAGYACDKAPLLIHLAVLAGS